MASQEQPQPIWPHDCTGCISLTMDNLGEAADLNRGVWPSDQPIGSHFTTTDTLPRMLALLSDHKIRATYFIEAWNNSVYPDVIGKVKDSGHEIGFHAWQHEVWKNLDGDTEVANLDRSVKDAKGFVDVEYRGFRPPGGLVTDRTLALMKERGFRYLSPAAERPAVVDGVAMVPFRWREIDAYFYMKATSGLRIARGDPEETMGADVVSSRLCDRIDQVAKDGGYSAFLFHPFLQTSEDRMQTMEQVLVRLKEKEGQGRGKIWVAPCGEVADWILKHPDHFPDDPLWDTAEWKKK